MHPISKEFVERTMGIVYKAKNLTLLMEIGDSLEKEVGAEMQLDTFRSTA